MGDDDQKTNATLGSLYGLGVGPGDPEFITLKAIKVLHRADSIFVPRAEKKSISPAARIVKYHVPEKEIKEIVFPMTKNKQILHNFWFKTAVRVYEELKAGKEVACTTLGDPSLYSSYGYLTEQLMKLDRRIEIITIPGVNSISAASALGNIPLVMADERLAVLPMPSDPEDLKPFLVQFHTVVIMKIGARLFSLVEFLKREHLEKSFFFAKRIGFPEQYFGDDISLVNTQDKKAGNLAIVIIKK